LPVVRTVTEIRVYGEQEHSAYNGHFESTCYHPLLLFNGEGDCLGAKLRPAHVHSAEDWGKVLLPEIERQQALGKEVVFRAEAAFAKPKIYEALEERRSEIWDSASGQRRSGAGHRGTADAPSGTAQSQTRRMVQGLSLSGRQLEDGTTGGGEGGVSCREVVPPRGLCCDQPGAVVRFYNQRGTTEQWIKEGKQAVKMTRLSCHRLRSNEVRLWLNVLAYNLGNLWRRLALPRKIENWSLTSLQQRLVKTGGRLVKHARYYWLLLAEGHLNRRRFAAMLGGIALLPLPTGQGMVVKPAAESVSSGLSKEKWGRTWGKLRCLGADLRPLGALQMKIVSQRRRTGGIGVLSLPF
jgi:hypothetical protein